MHLPTLPRLLVSVVLAAASVAAQAVEGARLRVAIPEPHLRRIDVEVVIHHAPRGETLFRFPDVLPGRTVRDEPGAWIDDVSVDDGDAPLPWRRTALGTIAVTTGAKDPVRLRFRRRLDRDARSVFDVGTGHASFLGGAVFPACDGVDGPVVVEIAAPTAWATATTLAKDGATRARATSFDEVAAARFLVGTGETWTPDTVATVFHLVGAGASGDATTSFVAAVGRLVAEAERRLGVPSPAFIAVVGGPEAGAASIHVSSGAVEVRGPARFGDATDRDRLLRDVARGLGRRALPTVPGTETSSERWFLEGATEHLADLLLAGTSESDSRFTECLADRLRRDTASPRARMLPPARASELAFDRGRRGADAPGNDLAVRGGLLVLALDLHVRAGGSSGLPDVLRALRDTDGPKVFDRRRLVAAFDRIAPKALPADFFARHVDGTEPVDLKPLLASIGFELESTNGTTARLGAATRDFTVTGFDDDSPLRLAGASEGDRLVGIGTSVLGERGAESVEQVLARHRPGDVVTVTWRSADGRVTQKAVRATGAPPTFRVEPAPVVDEATARRKASFLRGATP